MCFVFQKNFSKRMKKISMILIVVLAVLLMGLPVLAQEKGIEFFKGKTINFITPHSVGGGYDAYSRAFVSYLQKYLPGSTIIVDNASGAGGIIGRNKIYNAKPDGLTIGLETGSGSIFTQLTEIEGVKYDVTKMTVFGRLAIDVSVLAVGGNSPFYSLSDLKSAKEPIKIAISGIGSDDFYTAKLLCDALGVDVKIIGGYAGAREGALAAVRGETDAVHTEVTTVLPLIRTGDLRPIWCIALERNPFVPDVPTSVELAKRASEKEASLIVATTKIWATGRMIIGPPNIPEELVKVLREAVFNAMNDSAFIEWSKKVERPIAPLAGEDLEKLIIESMEMADELVPVFKGYIE